MKKKLKQFWFNLVFNIGFISVILVVFYLAFPISGEKCMRLIIVSLLAEAPGSFLTAFLYWGGMPKKTIWLRRIIIIITYSVSYGLFYLLFGVMKLDSIMAYIIYCSTFLLGSLAQAVLYLIADLREKKSIEIINKKLTEYRNN